MATSRNFRSRSNDSHLNVSRAFRIRSSKQRNARLRLQYELLEPRHLLASDLDPAGIQPLSSPSSASPPSAPFTWFETLSTAQRVPLASLASVDRSLPEGTAGPQPLAIGEWIVQLTDDAASRVRSLHQATALFDDPDHSFTIISGLGFEGGLLVRGEGFSKATIEASLRANESIETFSLNQLIQGQATTPNESDFAAGLLPGLNKINATAAWDESIGSMSTVVGVVDSGIDPTHPDLYLNIWLNQGEIPPNFLDDDGNKLVDVDGDGLITFYDLNHATRATTTPYALTVAGFANGPNAEFVRDLNNNGRIDADDLLKDALWTSGTDDDGNGFFDDIFGVNFRAGAGDPFASNNPTDELGHGTHVAGTIGAIGSNGSGVVGVNWQTSLMSLRILDNNNQGDSGAAIRALNYALDMRERMTINSANRVTEGADVKVLNNSWGQPGGYEASLESAIKQLYEANILFVAAAGNGNILGNGVDNDRTPFYPASYDVPNVIAVAAVDANDRLATFSNFGKTSVDLLAPGVGIRSTVPGGGYQSANGTSMATPHVAGTAALIWSALPESTVDEIKQAILSTTTAVAQPNIVATGGRLNANAAINADVFAPAAKVVSRQNVETSGATPTEFSVQYSHRNGIDSATVGNANLIVARQWGPKDELIPTLKPGSIVQTATTLTATYTVSPPGGTWDPYDYGDYKISVNKNSIKSSTGKTISAMDIGSFKVQIADPSFYYVSRTDDSLESGSLRSAIIAANVANGPITIILDEGDYQISLPPIRDNSVDFPFPDANLYCGAANNLTGWSNASSGDFDVTGNIRIVGNQNNLTSINGMQVDRVFKVHPGAELALNRLAVTGGIAPSDQGGGGILSAGELKLEHVVVRNNNATGAGPFPTRGGGIAAWDGAVELSKSWVTENVAGVGAGIFFCGSASGIVSQSTFSANLGGGLHSHSDADVVVNNSTFSSNEGGRGAIFNGKRDGIVAGNQSLNPASISRDGRYVAFQSSSPFLIPGTVSNENTGNVTSPIPHVYVYDRQLDRLERLGQGLFGANQNDHSEHPTISADGQFVVFHSRVSGAANPRLFIHDRTNNTTTEIAGSTGAFSPTISGNGRYIVFNSSASSFVPNDTNGTIDIFVYDRQLQSYERVSVSSNGSEANSSSTTPTISDDGRYVAFASFASNLDPNDTTTSIDVFVHDRTNRTTRVISRHASDSLSVASDSPKISGDGSILTFTSTSTSLLPNLIGQNVFAYVMGTGAYELVSRSPLGASAGGSKSAVSENGRYIAFESFSSAIVGGDGNNANDVFIHDRLNKTTVRASVGTGGVQGNDYSRMAAISGDGSTVVFHSDASNLVKGDTNGSADYFLRDLVAINTKPITYQEVRSQIAVTQTTIARTTDARFAVEGAVDLVDVLLVNDIGIETQGSLKTNILDSSQPAVALIGDLTSGQNEPPYHPLLRGNPAIDRGGSSFINTLDQRGMTRLTPDIGAFEATSAIVSGTLFGDVNNDQRYSLAERGITDVMITLKDSSGNLISTTTRDGLPIDNASGSAGSFSFGDVVPGIYTLGAAVPENFSFSIAPIARNPIVIPDGISENSSFDYAGRSIVFSSSAPNLVPGDTNGKFDLFHFDRQTLTTTSITATVPVSQLSNSSGYLSSVSDDGRLVAFRLTSNVFLYDRDLNSATDLGFFAGEWTISGDGKFLTFSTFNSHVAEDTNGEYDVYVYDIRNRTFELVSVSEQRVLGNGTSRNPTINGNGRYVAYTSTATSLVPGVSSNTITNLYLRDRLTNTVTHVLGPGNVEPNGDIRNISISANGQVVAFDSSATNLVAGDANAFSDAFVFSTETGVVERVSVNGQGDQGFGGSSTIFSRPAVSADGRFVGFTSCAPSLVPQDTNGFSDIFVRDRVRNIIRRVNLNASGLQANGQSFSPSISDDGRLITFSSDASNLVLSDLNQRRDVFVVANPLIEPGLTLFVEAGDRLDDIQVGVRPLGGVVSGFLFEDVVSNSTRDVGEPALAGWTVFLDENVNGRLDEGEISTTTDSSGSYTFTSIASFRDYSVRVVAQTGWTGLDVDQTGSLAWNLFLPAGGVITDRNFGFQRVTTIGQSSASNVSGRLFVDNDNSGGFSSDDTPLAGWEVFLDAANFGTRDPNEPRELTDSLGRYQFTGLSARNVAVTTVLDQTLVHVNPLGSKFDLAMFPLFGAVTPFGNPQAIAAGHFNGDGFLDAAVALGEANKLSIRLNDGKGGFLPEEIDIDLGTTGAGPTSLVVGQFDNDAKLDVALTANFTGNVMVLRNFDPLTKSFASTAYVKVGDEPLDIAAGQFAGDAKLDFVVVNRAGNTVQVLTNNGSGDFTAGPGVPTGGRNASSIVVGNFTGDASLDVAVVHAIPRTGASNPFGEVTLLRGNGTGGLTLQPQFYTVGATPTDAAVGDFNKDGRPDIAVSNFATNSISILLGQADGTLRVQTAILGTASGAFDLTVGDIDNDGDLDVIASNLRDRNISIFRNIGVVGGEVQFEPLENIGLGQFSLAQRMPLVVGNFDNDTSGPGGTGTIDIVTIPQKTDTLHLLKNTLVNGSHRVALTGLNTITGRDFIIKSAVLPPSFNSISNPAPIVEDAKLQSVVISGIKKGRNVANNLRFVASSSNTQLIGNPAVIYVDGSATAVVRFTPNSNASGTSVITIRAEEKGADGVFGGADDGIHESSFTVTVVPVNDPPTFRTPAELSVTQKSGMQSRTNFVTSMGKGAPDEGAQSIFDFVVTADSSFFSVMPSIDNAGTLTFSPSLDRSGLVPVTLSRSDDGGTANGGIDTTTQTFVLNIMPVNDAPSFSLGSESVSVGASAGSQTRSNFAIGFAPGGGADEQSQSLLDYVVATNAPSLFSVLPDIDNNGTLTFTPAIDRSGLATVTVRVRDDGGRANGGVDLSAPLTFTILVEPAPISYSIAAASAIKPEGQSISDPTPFTFTVTRSGLTSGIGTVQYAVTGSGSNPAIASDFANNVLPQGTIAFAAGETSKTLTINVEGDTLVEPNEGFVVTLSSPSDSATIATATAVGVIQNDDTSLAITATDATKPEGHSPTGITPLTFTVTRSGLTTGTTTVGYKVTASSLNPVSGADFQGNVFPIGTVSFAAGETSKLITVPVVGDTVVEPDERLVVSLHTPSAGATITTTAALGIIQNDDVAFAIAIASSAASPVEGQSLTTPTLVPFTVTRTGSLSGTDSVNYTVITSSTNPVTAADFQGGVFPSGTVTFAPGEFRKTLNIPVAGDSLVELHERFIVSLIAPSGQATIIRPNALATILDDDTTFVIAATSASKSEGRSLSTPFTFTITRSGVTTGTSTVGYTVTGVGSTPATANDFTGNAFPSGTLTFGPNVKTQVLTINVAGDAIVESDEAFVVTLHTPSIPSTIKTATANGVIRNDDTSFSIAATSAVKPEGQSGVTPFTFTVTRNGLTNGIATVNYAVTPSSLNPVNANDFSGSLFPSGTLIFGAGVSTQVITIPVVGDSVSEADERFVVSLSASSSPTTITAAGALGVIQNDDVGGAAFSGPPLPTGPSSDTSNYDLLLNSSESWQFAGVELVGGEVHHRFRQAEGEAEVSFIAPSTFTNPLNRFDVDGNGSVASLDALRIINALSRRTLVDGLGHFLPLTAATASQFQYLDVNVDAKLTPLDALQVINALSRQQRQRTPQASSSTLASPPDLFTSSRRAEGESSPQDDQPSSQFMFEESPSVSPSTVPSTLTPFASPTTPKANSSRPQSPTKLTASLVDDLFGSSSWGTFDDGI